MTFQKNVRFAQAAGIVGELAFDTPSRVTPGFIESINEENSYVGRFYTFDPVNGKYNPGGTIGTGDDDDIFGGISIMPKEYVSLGNSTDGPLGATLKLPAGQVISFCEMGEIWLYTSGRVQVGDELVYNMDTGVITPQPRTGDIPARSSWVPNSRVHRVPNLPTDQGSMYVVKLTN